MGSDLVPMPSVLLEACVESLEHAVAAEEGGAARIELCAALDVGGLTPPPDLVEACASRLRIPVFVMVRPRAGAFILLPGDAGAMVTTIREMRDIGASGVVVGALRDGGEVDVHAVAGWVAAADGLPVTFHRAFDEVPDQAQALEVLVALGVARVLTAGGRGTALEGADRIAALVRQAAGRIGVLAGGSVREQNAAALVARTGVGEVHSRTPADPVAVRRLVAAANRR